MIEIGDKYKYLLKALEDGQARLVKSEDIQCDICGDWHSQMYVIIADNSEIYFVGLNCMEDVEVCINTGDFITKENSDICEGCNGYMKTFTGIHEDDLMCCDECYDKIAECKEPMFPDDCL